LQADCNDRCQTSRLPRASVLILLANWVNFSVSIILIPLIIFRCLLSPALIRSLVQQTFAARDIDGLLVRKVFAYPDVCSVGLLAIGMMAGRAMSRLVHLAI
jgi:hypothetical protein